MICQGTALRLPAIKIAFDGPVTDRPLRGREQRHPRALSVPNRAGGRPAERLPITPPASGECNGQAPARVQHGCVFLPPDNSCLAPW
ncbi:MAG: hypothetical protein KatS3mg058_1292 [Roseiflexus sp.]|nr:MAG: hypothetical protein KatS3mg058_1292 [Roseiflexus sp.]